MSDPQTTNETLARAVCKAWKIDPDGRGWGGDDGTFYVIGWQRSDVQKFVAAFLACSEALNHV